MMSDVHVITVCSLNHRDGSATGRGGGGHCTAITQGQKAKSYWGHNRSTVAQRMPLFTKLKSKQAPLQVVQNVK